MKRREKELKRVLNDKVHGSSELLDLVYNHIYQNTHDKVYLAHAIKQINNNLSHFPVILRFTNKIKALLKSSESKDIKEYLDDFVIKKDHIYKTIYKKAKNKFIKFNTILTISHSKTLIKIFEMWTKSRPDLKIIVCESRPENEGILMAEELINFGIVTEVITEAISGNVIKKVDAVILGADQILTNGNIINKSGSRMLAVLANYHRIPVFVLASRNKQVKRKTIFRNRSKGKKANNSIDKLIKYRSETFEEIESQLIRRIFTD